jgi:putative hydrolase of the HAD superfamily
MRAAIFDLDDTLYSREQFVQSGFAAVADNLEREHALLAPWAMATLRHAHAHGQAGYELQALCADHGLTSGRVPELVKVFRAHEPSLDLAPAAAGVLARMRAEGWRLGILTNGLPDTQRAKVDALGLESQVDAVLYAEQHAPGGKPSRAAFDAALAALGVAPAQSVFVGDDLVRDVHGARAAGLSTIRIATTRPVAGDVDDEGRADADVVVAHLEDVPQAAAHLVKGAGTHAA